VGTQKCNACGAENKGDARFCANCGSALSAEPAPASKIVHHRWARGQNDFAVRIKADDLPGWLRQGIIVEPGTCAALVERGVMQGILPPGEYTVANVGQKIAAWLTGGIPERTTALLLDVTPAALDYNLGKVFTSDPLEIGLTLRLQVEVTDPGKFLVNLLKGREKFTLEDLRQYLYPEIVQAAEMWIRQHTVKELTENPRLKFELEAAIGEALNTTLQQSGLHFIQVRAMEISLEQLDRIKGIQSKAVLMSEELVAGLRLAQAELDTLEQQARQDAEGQARLAAVRAEYEHRQAEAGLAARKRYAALQQEQDLVELAEETGKVEKEERMADLYERMRQAVMSDKMKEVRSEADFDAFLEDIDRQKLLREKERSELLRTWKEAAEDHELARAHLLAKLEIERGYELRLAELKLKSELDTRQLASETEIARKRADLEWELKRKQSSQELELERDRLRIAAERAKAQLEIDRMQRDQKRDQDGKDAELGMKLLAQMKQIQRLDAEENLRIQRVDELERAKARQQLEIQRLEVEMRQRQAEREHELARLEKMKGMTTEQLIMLSGPEQAQALVALRETEALRGMSAEQILAMAARNAPEIGLALAQAQGSASQRERELQTQMQAQNDAALQRERENIEKHRQDADKRAQDLKDAMGMMVELARGQGSGQGSQPPVIVVGGSGAPQVVSPQSGAGVIPAGPAAPSAKICTHCGRSVAVESRHCEYCGHKFEGMG
jgi:hypothetical protein